MIATGKAHGKIILIGEHAVVYGQPAITIPLLDIPTKVQVKATSQQKSYINSTYYQGDLENAPNKFKGIVLLIALLSKDLPISKPVQLDIQSDLPLERGMGSSAATAAAITKAMFAYAHSTLTPQQLIQYTNFAEQITHGTPSGVDAVTVNSKSPIYYIKDKLTENFNMNIHGYLTIIDSGVTGNTGEAVHDLRILKNSQPAVIDPMLEELGQLTFQAQKSISNQQLTTLGNILTRAQNILKMLQVSTPQLDQLIKIANQAGALGTKITGSGRGGCLISLSDNLATAQNIAQQTKKNGAVRTWIQTLHQN
ncbi:mevalonate kinase [Bombilactobacillus thymidiniphilus]|uniref:Mevalonate kinase n=1 Tax=Bombilactobacillus thymidiniphilus TaxID=2923363 RepID=A0ABY4PDI7_9LACO|nr:mevalonate kinase [Bombilactobacillus thymidiniphilus]UQS83559.1 mevalonate kinase [Bombilactobacillus thymidiniphilus]